MINLSFPGAIRYLLYVEITLRIIVCNYFVTTNFILLYLSNYFYTVYIDAGLGQTNPVTLTFVTSGQSFARSWKIQVSQIRCNTIYRAEEGCLQYFTGISGQIKSFNYDPITGLQLSNQDYSICIRMERNFCGIQYMICPIDDKEGIHKEDKKK